MNRITTGYRRLVYRLKHDFFTSNNILLVVALVLCATWVWSSITAMTKNWELAARVETNRQDAARLALEVEMLEYEKIYYETEEYQELAAREKAGKMLEGETMLILPENSEVAKKKYSASSTPAVVSTVSEKTNFDEWVEFLFGA